MSFVVIIRSWRLSIGLLTRLVAVASSVLGFTRAAAANLREKDDAWASAISGGATGAVLGIPCTLIPSISLRPARSDHSPYLPVYRAVRTMPAVIGNGAALAIIAGVFTYTGGRFDGFYNRREEDGFEIRERMMKNRRKSLEETIAEVGEGRGMSSPRARSG